MNYDRAKTPEIAIPVAVASVFVAVLMTLLLGPTQSQAAYKLDRQFGNSGLVTTDLGPAETTALVSSQALAGDRQGRLIFGAANFDEWQIRRYWRGGELDSSFGTDGIATVADWGGIVEDYEGNASVTSAAVRPDGRILLVGFTRGGSGRNLGAANLIMKQLTPDGAPDLSFGDSNGGLEFESSVGAADVTLQPDGKFLVAGFKEKGRSTNGLLVRFLPNGKKDPSFGNRGRMSIGHKGNRASYVFDVDVLKNGRILASGTQSNQYMVMKLHPNGRFVKSFGNGGKKVLGVAGKRCRCELGRRFTRDRKGRILITGYVQPPKREKPIYGAIVRLKPNGKVDRSFGRRGVVRLYDGRSTKLYDIAVDKKGGIWTTGTGGPEFGKRRTSTIRLLPSGRLDRRTSRIGALSKPLGDAGAGWGLLPVGRSIYASGRWEKGGSESTYLRRFVPRR